MDASLQMEYLQGLLRLALQQTTSVPAQPVEDSRSAKPDLPDDNRSGNVNPSSAKPISSPISLVADTATRMYSDDERMISRFETLLDNKLEVFKERVIAPLANDIRHIGQQCTRIEANMLLIPEIAKQALNGTAVSNERPSMPGSYIRPSRSPNSSVASFSENLSEQRLTISKSQPSSSKTMKMVSDLLAQIGRDGLSSGEVPMITLDGGNGVSLADRDRPLTTAAVNHKPLGETNDNTSDWSDSVFGDWRELKPARSKSARPFLQSGNKGSKYVMPEEKKIGETLVVVDDVNGVAVRSLDPRPCHRYYLSESGCINDHCSFGHGYRLNSEHIRCLKKFVEVLPCSSIKNGVPCRGGEDCIYAHKCTYGWNCKYGESCRFFDIPGAHPDSGEFHKKKNYYDSFHNAPLEQEVNSSGW